MLRFPVNNHVITSYYGDRTLNGKYDFHSGIDLISREDNRVYAVADGVCTYDYDNYSEARRWTDQKDSAGNYVILQHVIDGKKYYARYFHLSENLLSVGDKVTCGQLIGKYGDYGYSFGPHLHFDLWDENWTKNEHETTIINPMDIFSAVVS